MSEKSQTCGTVDLRPNPWPRSDSPIYGPTPDCRFVLERLPWLATGVLPTGEHEAITSHLEGCPECRREARASQELTGLLDSHVPTAELVRFALGENLATLSPDDVRRHVDTCAACRLELDFVTAAETDAAAGGRVLRRAGGWSHAVAASFGALTLAAGLILAGKALPFRPGGPEGPAAGPVAHEARVASGDGLFGDGFESGDFTGWAITSSP